MACSNSVQPSAFYLACCDNDMKTIRETITRSQIDTIGPWGNTALHAASCHGHAELVRLLLRYNASHTIRNDDGCTAEELAANPETKAMFKALVRTTSDSNHYVASSREVEWLDTYKNAYRISYENHEHMKRWLTKVALQKLLKEIDSGYIDKIKFADENDRAKIKKYLTYVIELEDPLGLLQAYTDPRVQFHSFLNHDLAEFGSDFRFVSTQALINSGYLDNEAPKGLGQYIFASILINHSRFRPYHYTGTIYRGMNITRKDLHEYDNGHIVMTRSFLSTSKNRDVAELFLNYDDYENKPAVICVYTVINSRSSLYIENASKVEGEDEVLIVPFTVFQVKTQREVELIRTGKNCRIIEIELEEGGPNPV